VGLVVPDVETIEPDGLAGQTLQSVCDLICSKTCRSVSTTMMEVAGVDLAARDRQVRCQA